MKKQLKKVVLKTCNNITERLKKLHKLCELNMIIYVMNGYILREYYLYKIGEKKNRVYYTQLYVYLSDKLAHNQ